MRLNLAALALASCAASPLLAQENLPVRNCLWCHGTAAQGFTSAPRLAGQKPQYIENQLVSFNRRLRDNPYSQQYMWGAAANLTPQLAHDFAIYFSTLSPEPANDGNPSLTEEGKALYDLGAPESNIVSCVACHGPKGEGFEGIPRLGGLSASYLKRRLEQWGEGFHAAAGPMPRIAGKLSPEAIAALASYLSFVR